jgi:NADH/NAD ratio-sensing transcriptional regulator Rex
MEDEGLCSQRVSKDFQAYEKIGKQGSGKVVWRLRRACQRFCSAVVKFLRAQASELTIGVGINFRQTGYVCR